MKNIDPLAGQTATVVAQNVRPAYERVTVTPLSPAASHLLADRKEWTWEALRDYVIREIESRHGPQPRDPRKEKAVFSSFLSRWPQGKAVDIAEAAFQIYDGWWGKAPISVNRFCKASDPYFATPIMEKLER